MPGDKGIERVHEPVDLNRYVSFHTMHLRGEAYGRERGTAQAPLCGP